MFPWLTPTKSKLWPTLWKLYSYKFCIENDGDNLLKAWTEHIRQQELWQTIRQTWCSFNRKAFSLHIYHDLYLNSIRIWKKGSTDWKKTCLKSSVGFATFKKVIATLSLLSLPRIIAIAILLPYQKIIAIATIILRSDIATFRYFFDTFHILLNYKKAICLLQM